VHVFFRQTIAYLTTRPRPIFHPSAGLPLSRSCKWPLTLPTTRASLFPSSLLLFLLLLSFVFSFLVVSTSAKSPIFLSHFAPCRSPGPGMLTCTVRIKAVGEQKSSQTPHSGGPSGSLNCPMAGRSPSSKHQQTPPLTCRCAVPTPALLDPSCQHLDSCSGITNDNTELGKRAREQPCARMLP
jgi:hypothetical protein